MNENPYIIDKRQVRRSFDAAAADYDAVAVLQRQVGENLIQRLELIRHSPGLLLDVGAGTGVATRALMKRYPKARVAALDLAPAMLRRARKRAPWHRRLACVCADAEHLPFNDASVDMIFSNLAVQWCPDLDRAFREFQRVLRPEGLLMFSTFGPDTLRELRSAWSEVDGFSHVSAFMDMHDVGDALVRARFADPVMDVESFTLTYDRTVDLMRDLKTLGAGNATAGRARGLTGRARMRAVADAYERFRDPDKRLPATYEVVYGHAWGAEGIAQLRDASGAVGIPLSSLKQSLRGGGR